MGQEIILVAGVDYPVYHRKRKSDNGWSLRTFGAGPWRSYSELVARRVLKANNKLRVTLFDFYKGTREKLKLDSKGNLMPPVEEDKLGTLIPENYRLTDTKLVPPSPEFDANEWPEVRYYKGINELSRDVLETQYQRTFIDSDNSPREQSISITDVYDYIRQAGVTREHEVNQLHIFSHGWAAGPILANTRDWYPERPGRDPYDKDGRAMKDFEDDLMNQFLGAAFSTGATSYVWGCNAQTYMKKLIVKTIEKGVTLGSPDLPKLQFKWNETWEIDEEDFHTELGGTNADHNSRRFSKKDVIKYVRKVLNGTYMHKLASASKIRVIGALPGTYSEYDKPKYSNYGETLMHIPMGANFGDDPKKDYRQVLGYYKDKLGVKFEHKKEYSPVYGRGYGIYEP